MKKKFGLLEKENSSECENELVDSNPSLEFAEKCNTIKNAFITKVLRKKHANGEVFTEDDLSRIESAFLHILEKNAQSIDLNSFASNDDFSPDLYEYGRGYEPAHIKAAIEKGKSDLVEWMNNTTISSAIQSWLDSIEKPSTQEAYRKGIRNLEEKGFIKLKRAVSSSEDIENTLYQFSHVPHDLIPGKIFHYQEWSDHIKSRNASAYKNFIKYLESKTEGIISFINKPLFAKKATSTPSKTISREDLEKVLSLLKKENFRDYCFVRLYLSSNFKLCEILNLRKKNLDLHNKAFTSPEKTFKSSEIFSAVTSPDFSFSELLDTDFIFRTRTGKPLDPMQITRTLQRIFKKANITPLSLKDLKKNYSANHI